MNEAYYTEGEYIELLKRRLTDVILYFLKLKGTRRRR